ncbi:hypothetical protein PV325_012658 [Microctonus aethiopoides]|uniref:Cytochrome c oxidase assembly protein COX15 homolog n=1 Tax=Microctonus aethiopoides TaxID=144406 RepID=A0AA39C7D8_9HYME|nr:hypothetical protein PV325_012658 [Microctonus aethiopoides]KAK0159292.1 hypothetical protein PV328_010186 [Microctonus aethiopoides]
MSLMRLCIKGLQRTYTSNYSLITKRSIYHALQKSPKHSNWSAKGITHRLRSVLLITPTTQTGSVTSRFVSAVNKKSNKYVGSWLLICGGMVFVAVALGGITRLTESGLSMVTWKFAGEKMPSNDVQWLEEFDKYKQYPEYKIMNKEMTLDEFKRIWWMEYAHRMWGRLIGATFVIPAAYFWINGMLKSEMKIKVVALGTLIGLQGLMGWYMVKSGLEDRFHDPMDVPRVSQYRLAAHLGLALAIFSGFLYNALDHLVPARSTSYDLFGKKNLSTKTLRKFSKFKGLVNMSMGLVFITAISGAFVAGLDAGLIYNTFPKMANKWIPDDILALTPTLRNFTENPTTVQFNHRLLGISTVTMITIIGLMSRKLKLPGKGSKAMIAVILASYLQVALGITTLLNHVPLPLAASHQSGSLLLLSSVIWLCHELKYVRKFIK